MKRRELLTLSTAILALAPLRGLHAQAQAPAAATPQTAAQAPTKPYTAAQLDQMLAPIALYPDALLAQTLMAATYPLEVVEAARWSQANPNLKGDAAVAAVKDKSWDVSVKSLVAFPQVLAMMNDKLDWTQKIGDAMLAEQADVADSVQRLRAKAAAAGNLKTTPQQKVTTQGAGTASTIVIEPANPEVIYVPYYNPAWAYGPWPYPAYPPVYYPPPPAYGAALMTGMMFGIGLAAGSAMFGGWNWGHGNSYVNVNVNKATSISANNFNANHYANGALAARCLASRRRALSRHPDPAALRPEPGRRRRASAVSWPAAVRERAARRPDRPTRGRRASGAAAAVVPEPRGRVQRRRPRPAGEPRG